MFLIKERKKKTFQQGGGGGGGRVGGKEVQKAFYNNRAASGAFDVGPRSSYSFLVTLRYVPRYVTGW